MTNPPLIIYHAECLDGFGAAYAAYHYFLTQGITPDFHAANHGEGPPPCRERTVYILDFSYRRAVMCSLCAEAAEVIVIDHHCTALDDLAGLDAELPNLRLHFDMEQSGAVLAWQYFHPEVAPPRLLLHVQDQDLWRFKLPATHDIGAAIWSYPFSFSRWDGWAKAQRLTVLQQDGQAINRYLGQLVEQYRKKAVIGEIAGYQIPVVNCPAAIVSPLLHRLSEGHPFAAAYQDRGTVRRWSLRSREEGADVAQIAVLFGGGGHPHAAGFGTTLPDALLCVTVPSV